MLIENVKACRDFLFAYGANGFYQRIGFAENIYSPEKYSRSVIKLFFVKYLATFARWIYLPDCSSVESLICVSYHQLFFFVRHGVNIRSFSAFCNSYHLYRLFYTFH